MDSKHTTGPWMTSPNAEHVRRTFHGYNICSLNTNDDEPTWRANAALISAAPELLEALKGILAITDRNHVVWDRARAAIAKAEGRHG